MGEVGDDRARTGWGGVPGTARGVVRARRPAAPLTARARANAQFSETRGEIGELNTPRAGTDVRFARHQSLSAFG